MKSDKRGFTLLETMIVVILVISLSSIFIVSYRKIAARVIVNDFVSHFNDDLLILKQYAMTNCEKTTFYFNDDEKYYRLKYTMLGYEIKTYYYNENITLDASGVYGLFTFDKHGDIINSGDIVLTIYGEEFTLKVDEIKNEVSIEE